MERERLGRVLGGEAVGQPPLELAPISTHPVALSSAKVTAIDAARRA
jgi:hypothetical protein